MIQGPRFLHHALSHRVHAALLALALGVVVTAQAADNPKAGQFYEDALQRFEKKDYGGAVVQLKNAIKIDPKMLPVQVLLGKALLASGQIAAAEVAFNEAVKLGVNRAEISVPLARTLVAQGRLQDVVSEARFPLAGLPPGIKAQMLLVQAAAHSDLGSPKEALKAIEDARQIEPSSAESWVAEIPIRIRARQFKEAQAAADRALALEPDSADAHYLRGSIAHAQGNVAAALADYTRSLQSKPEHLEALIARAGLAVDQGRLDDALADIATVRKASPQDPRAPYLRSVIAEKRGDGKTSRAALAEVVGVLDPVPLDFLRFRPQLLMLGGLSHYGLGNYGKALPYLERIVRLDPGSPAAKLLGQIYTGDRNHDRAIETLEGYVKSQPRDQHAVVLLATAQMAKGRPMRAAQLLQDAAKLEDSPRLRTFLGLALVGGGRRLDAIAELENAYRRDPSQVIAGAALVDLYLGRKLTAKAVATAESLVRKAPKEAQYQMLLGIARAQSGEPAKARAAYEAALKLDPAFAPAIVNLARLDLQTDNVDAAGKRLDALLAKDDKNVDVMIELARVAERRDRAADAVRMLQRADDLSGGKDLRPLLQLVDFQLRRGDNAAAAAAAKKLVAKAPDQLAVLLASARVAIAAADFTAAKPLLERASRTAEYDAEIQSQIALQQLQAQDPKGALYSLTKALQGQPDFLPAKALSVDVNLRLGDTAAAEKGARDLLARNPSLAVSHSLLGDVAMARGQTAAAVDFYRRAHQIEPTSSSMQRLFGALLVQSPAAATQAAERWLKEHPKEVELRRMMANAYARTGDYAAARSAYESLVAALPGDAEALNNLANVLLLQKDPGALAVAERALALKPTAPHIIGTTGWAAFRAGNTDRALQLLRDARLRDPNNPDTRYFLAAVLASKGRSAEAREELRGMPASVGGATYAKEAGALLKTLN